MKFILLFSSLSLFFLNPVLKAQNSAAKKPENSFPETDIWMVQATFRPGSSAFGGVKNISERPGYDNQPHFGKDGNLYYVSIREDLQADIFRYDMQKKFISKFTVSKTSEYSPKSSPDGQNISTVTVEKDSSQKIYRTDLATGLFSEPISRSTDSVGYYTWLNDSMIAFAKITKPMSLWMLNTKNGVEKFIAADVGRSLAVSEGGLLYFTQMRDGKRWLVRQEKTGQLQGLIEFQDNASEDFCFAPNNIILNGRKGMLFFTDHDFTKGWRLAADWERSGIKNIQRLAVSPDGKWLSFVEAR
jgi:hypothetical protein